MVLHEAAEINTHGSWLMALFDLSMVEVIWAGVYTIHKFERW